MSTAISSIRNLGPETQSAFARAGVTSAEELRALGTDDAYAKLLAHGERPQFIAYYALEMALQGRPWNDCKGAEKDALRTRFDALKSHALQNSDGMEAILNSFGVVPAARMRP